MSEGLIHLVDDSASFRESLRLMLEASGFTVMDYCNARTFLAAVALLPSGLAAISTALLSVAGAGDHILVTDSAYRPTRNFCEGVFKRMGVETTYYDPQIGADIAKLFKPNTRAVFVEAPGSKASRCRTFQQSQMSPTTRAPWC